MDLTTTYMGLPLPSPLVASASPLSADPANVKALADAGAGAVVMHSVFEEQLDQDAGDLEHYLTQGADSFAEALSYFPPPESFPAAPDAYLKDLAQAKKAAGVPIIGSLNGVSAGGWTDYAKQIADAGADGLELNIYVLPTDPAVDAAEIERVHLDALAAVKSAVSIPVAMKLSPFFSALPNVAKRLADAGADALVLFNRFYQPDLDVENLQVAPRLVLSTSDEMRLPLRWIAILFGKVSASLAGTTGVHTGLDAAKMVLAGADVAMLCSALLANGIGRLKEVRDEMASVLASAGYASASEARGVLSQASCAEPAAFERANYVKALQSWT